MEEVYFLPLASEVFSMNLGEPAVEAVSRNSDVFICVGAKYLYQGKFELNSSRESNSDISG